jgi:hypothetical protein
MTDRFNLAGFRLPAAHPLTDHEAAWVDVLRSITDDRVPAPTLRTVQGLRGLLGDARGS